MSRILIVDDESLVLALLKRVLREAGYDTLEAESADQALQILRNYSGEVDLLLTDLKMPRVSGQELAMEVLKMRPDIKVVYMSGFCDRAAAGLDALSGAAEFVQKPFSRTALLSKIFAVLPQDQWPSALRYERAAVNE